jgi:septum formation protein
MNQIMVLASASPRRLELLRQIGIDPDLVDPPDVDEAVLAFERPTDYVRRMAREKLDCIAARHPDAWVIAADTVVACGRRVLPKPENQEQAGACLRLLGGRRHKVLGAIAIQVPQRRRVERVVITQVVFKRLSGQEALRYAAGGEWRGKAGGYAIQGAAAAFVRSINGSYSNVVGLSLCDVSDMLTGLGWAW